MDNPARANIASTSGWAWSLVVIGVVLTVAIVASLRADAREPDPDDTVDLRIE